MEKQGMDQRSVGSRLVKVPPNKFVGEENSLLWLSSLAENLRDA